jgi:hypothetical protein
VAGDVERRDADEAGILAAGEVVLGEESGEEDEVEGERGEGQVVAAQAEQGHADDRGDHAREHGRGGEREQRVPAGLWVEQPLVRVDPDREDPGRVGAERVEGALAE